VPDAAVPHLTDTHAHLSYILERSGRAALDAVLDAYSGCVGAAILDPGVDHDDFPKRKALYGDHPAVRLAAGIWPDADSLRDPDRCLASLETWVRDPACMAVGEAGLDYHWMNGAEEAQARLLTGQLELAERRGKPVIVHSREAHAHTLALVRSHAAKTPIVIHCFGYDRAAMEEYVAAGCWVSFAGNLTYPGSGHLRDACAGVPVGRLLLETDSPYMNPLPRRGRPSTPLDIGRTYEAAATLRGVTVEALATRVARNARDVFGPSWGP